MSYYMKTFFWLTLLSALLLFVGNTIAGQSGLVIAFGMAIVMNFVSYFFSDKIVLAMYNADEIKPGHPSGLYEMVANLSSKAKLPMPKVYIIPEISPNAFATGRNPDHAAVAVTEGILSILDKHELEGVLAHELGHIRNRDILLSTIAATFASAIMMLANMAKWAAIFGSSKSSDDEDSNPIALIVTIILAPLAAMLIQMAISKSREYLADETGAKITGNPYGLADALKKIAGGAFHVPLNHGGPETAHMFIVNPFSASAILNLFSTHPPVEERIRRLREMRPGASL